MYDTEKDCVTAEGNFQKDEYESNEILDNSYFTRKTRSMAMLEGLVATLMHQNRHGRIDYHGRSRLDETISPSNNAVHFTKTIKFYILKYCIFKIHYHQLFYATKNAKNHKLLLK